MCIVYVHSLELVYRLKGGNRNISLCQIYNVSILCTDNCLFKMATEVLKVETQDSIEALQREAEDLKKRLEEEKAKLKDVESNWHTFGCTFYIIFAFLTFVFTSWIFSINSLVSPSSRFSTDCAIFE